MNVDDAGKQAARHAVEHAYERDRRVISQADVARLDAQQLKAFKRWLADAKHLPQWLRVWIRSLVAEVEANRQLHAKHHAPGSYLGHGHGENEPSEADRAEWAEYVREQEQLAADPRLNERDLQAEYDERQEQAERARDQALESMADHEGVDW